MSIEHKNDQRFDYQRIGSGKNVVLVHGWGASSAIWSPIVEQLSQHYCLHLVNLPGVSAEPELHDYSLSNLTEVLLKKLPTNAIWCGWSLGGLVATYVAAHFPDRVEKLIQVSASLKFVEEGQWLGVKREVFNTFKAGVIKQPKKTLSRFFSLQAMGSETVKNDIAIIKHLLSDQLETTQFALLGGLSLLDEMDLRKEFSQLTVPCLSLFGEKDSLVPVANLSALIELLPSNQQFIFKKSAHAPFISEPNLFNQVLISFIEEE